MELASAIQDEFLTCNICLEGYMQPKQLPCLHTFCLKCLSHYIAQTVGQSGVLSVPCPLCRRTCVPPDPDPRKLHQWADQFPDNFFVASLRETVDTRKNEQAEETAAAAPDSPTGKQSTRYFMGEVNTCSKHLTHRMTHFCLSVNAGVCELCLADASHSDCEDKDHLEEEAARNNATGLLNKYRTEIEMVKQDIHGVKQSFSRKPRRLQMKKEEVEISVSDYFSALRSSCAKLLLSKEKEMVDVLNKVIEDESQKTSDGQNKCDDVMNSMKNTMSLFDTLTRSGPFNALHVLARVEGQLANISRLVTKMDQEAKTESVCFRPSSQSFEDHVSSFSMGEVVADFGSEEMAVNDSPRSGTEQGATAVEVRESDPDAGHRTTSDGSLQNLGSQMSELQLQNRQDRDVDTSAYHPSAPPMSDEPNPSSYLTTTSVSSDQHSPLPSAPPILEFTAAAPSDWYDRSVPTSSAVAEAFQRSMHKDVSCTPLMVFTGNMPNESRRGGICGAAKVDELNRAAFVDRHNHSVKIIDFRQSQIVGFLHLGELEPWDITFVSEQKELAVTCPGSRYLLFIPTQSRRLEIAYYYKLSHGYCCLAHLKDNQFTGGICSPFGQPAVHVFDTTGNVLHEILAGKFSYPRTIFANSTGSQIIISDWTSHAIVLVTSEGELVKWYREAASPKGVAVSELTGLLHMVDGKWARLYLLDADGHCLGFGKLDGCRDPRTVVVVSTSSSRFPDGEMTVVVDGNNAVHVMSLAS